MIEFGLLFIVCISATILFFVVFGELNRYKKMRKLQTIFDKSRDETILSKEDRRAKIGIFTRLEEKMLLANLNFLPCFLNMFTVVLGLAIGVLFYLYLDHWVGYILGMILAILLVYFILETIISHRSKVFNRALAIAISILVKMMKNGVGFEQALIKCIEVSSSKMFQDLFEIYLKEKNTIGEMESFKSMSKHIESKELNIFAMSIKIGKSSGGKFSDTLEKVELTITYRKKLQDKIDVFTREASFGSYIVAAIGVFLYFMLDFNFQGRVHEYFMTSPYGRWQLLGIALWVVIGLVVNKLMTKVEK